MPAEQIDFGFRIDFVSRVGFAFGVEIAAMAVFSTSRRPLAIHCFAAFIADLGDDRDVSQLLTRHGWLW
jgi:hypothetical protein